MPPLTPLSPSPASHISHHFSWQFAHYARVDSLRRAHGPHDYVIRARLDVLFDEGYPLSVLALPRAHTRPDSTIYAVGFHALTSTRRDALGIAADVTLKQCFDRRESEASAGRADTFTLLQRAAGDVPDCPASSAEADADASPWRRTRHAWHFRDWLFVGTARAMEPLAQMTESGTLISRNDTRCFGLCQEEQVNLQLTYRNTVLHPLSARVALDRVNCSGKYPPSPPGMRPRPLQRSETEFIQPLQRTQPWWAAPCATCATYD